MKWTAKLENDVYKRLCNCHSLKNDIEALVNAKWGYMKETGKDREGFTREDALTSILELLDCNGQCFDLTVEEYEKLSK